MENEESIVEGQGPLVSIILLAFNHLDYTKICVESLYSFTSHINFELITVNNGSSDGTEEFFNSLSHSKKINFVANVGGDIAINAGVKLAEGRYTLFLSNDLVLTPNWLDNLLRCMESADNIGMVVPACSASSNYQQVNLTYSNMEEMIQAAAGYNVSNPLVWEERVRLITYTFLIKTSVFKSMGGFAEIYNPGGFDDDDLSFRMRRAGYKLMFAKDTFVHHYGSVTIQADYEKQNLLERNRWIFFEKFGVDAWEDCRIDFEMVQLMEEQQRQHQDVLTLCASCGGTLLQVKNKFRQQGITHVTWWAWTENSKYLADLSTVSDYVVQGPFGNNRDLLSGKLFDHIIIEVDLQTIENPTRLLEEVMELLKNEGQLIFVVANENYYLNVINMLNGNSSCQGQRVSQSHCNMEKIYSFISNQGFANLQISYSKVSIPPEHTSLVENLKNISLVPDKNLLDEIYTTKRVIFSATGKGQGKGKNIALYPGYDFWLNDMVFNDDEIGKFLGVGTGKNMWAILREECGKNNFILQTIDKCKVEQAEYIIFCDIPKSYHNQFFKNIYHKVYQGTQFFKEWQAKGKPGKLVLILLEPPFVMPENYDSSMHSEATIIFTYLDELVDNKKYFKYYYPQPLPVVNPYQKKYTEKQLITLIAGNKNSNVVGELYGERRRAIEYFQQQLGEDFDFYGTGWDTGEYPCYRGQVPGKLAVLAKYKYCICYENGSRKGYITEKIFDCFFAGCVPIYLGAPNITDEIPANTFIDGRDFASYEEMHRYIHGIDEEKYNQYLHNSNAFLHSDGFGKFTYGSFAQTILEVLQQNIE